jgi:hypothetical protein
MAPSRLMSSLAHPPRWLVRRQPKRVIRRFRRLHRFFGMDRSGESGFVTRPKPDAPERVHTVSQFAKPGILR